MIPDNAPIVFDLFCGLGGWADGFLAEGYRVIGFDIERHVYGEHRYPGELVLQDARTLHGSQLRRGAVIVASPPCQKYSYMAMPWSRAKKLTEWYRDSAHPERIAELNELFDTAVRLQREASEAAGKRIPLIIENVKGAQRWVGAAPYHFGSFYLWGDLPALMPFSRQVKVKAFNFHQFEKTGKPGGSFQSAAVNGIKGTGGSWFTPTEEGRQKVGHWRAGGCITRNFNSKSVHRKAASALIAKIPFELSNHIARVYKPDCSIPGVK